MSAHKEERSQASAMADGMQVHMNKLKTAQVRDALFLSKVCSYAQGMALLRAASKEYNWSLPMAEICRIWRGGCIIRSSLLGLFQQAFTAEPDLKNLLLDREVFRWFRDKHDHWRETITAGIQAGVPLPGMTASLSYFDAYVHERLPQNLIQAQRDLFGAHTYERTDKPGVFHTEWSTGGSL
jgi:6-phosphogluconate dehydrogenase